MIVLLTVTYENQTYKVKLVSPGYEINGNTALYLIKEDPLSPEEHIVSTNLTTPLTYDMIYLKNWSEYEGIEQPLIDAGIIEEFALNYIPSGHVRIPVYQLTDKALATL